MPRAAASRGISVSCELAAQCRHRFEDRLEQIPMIAPFLHPVVPPAFAIAVAIRLGKPLERIRPRRRFVFVLPQREHVGGWQIETTDRHVLPHRPADRVPLRRKPGERIERGLFRQVRAMHQQGDRRLHRLVRRMRQQRLQLQRHLYQHNIRRKRIQRRQQAARAARAMMTDAENRGHSLVAMMAFRSLRVSE